MTFYVIGITDNDHQQLSEEALHVIAHADVYSGGKRHHDLVRHLLPANHQWIDVTVPLTDSFAAYRELVGNLVVFASGDPLFYGFAATLQREFPTSLIRVYPTFNSLQVLAHRLMLPYGEMQMISLTGRPWTALDAALINNTRLIGVLTDGKKTPRAIAERLLEFGYSNYKIHIGENLGNERLEIVRTFVLPETPNSVSRLNCVIIEQTAPRIIPYGLPESEFALLDGRANMITKMPIRLATLAALQLSGKRCLWDVGFCTGSISIEARLRFPSLLIESFEIRPEGAELMQENAKRFGAPGIHTHIGDFMEENLDALPRPDAVFIGGHGGKLLEMIRRIRHYLLPQGIIVFNSVSAESQRLFRQALGDCHEIRIALDQHNPISILSWQQQ